MSGTDKEEIVVTFADLEINRQFLLAGSNLMIDIYIKVSETEYMNFFDSSGEKLVIDNPERVVMPLGGACCDHDEKEKPELSF